MVLIALKLIEMVFKGSGFRPLAGIMVLINLKADAKALKEESFRPLAGIMVLIDEDFKSNGDFEEVFPSPCGDYGSYHVYLSCVVSKHGVCFRPLAGIMVLIY